MAYLGVVFEVQVKLRLQINLTRRMSLQMNQLIKSIKRLISVAMILWAGAAAAHDTVHNCTVSVENTLNFTGMCNVKIDGEVTRVFPFTIGTVYYNEFEFFFYFIEGEETLAFWNEEPFANHAHTTLGTVTNDGACWRNTTFQLCIPR